MKSDVRESLLLAAVSYVDRLHWPVVPGGTWAVREHDIGRSGAGAGSGAGAPPQRQATTDPGHRRPTRNARTVIAWWVDDPDAAIMSPAGYRFDAVSVSKAAGLEALQRLNPAQKRGWCAIAAGDRITFLMPVGLGFQLRLRLGRRMNERVMRIYRRDDLVTLPPTPGVSWINADGPFVALSMQPHGLLPALVSACARQVGVA